MRRFPLFIALVSLTTTFFVSCTGGRGENGADGNDCTVTEGTDKTIIECTDGTKATIADGPTGPSGTNGADGENGADGFDGTDGSTSLLLMTDEPTGTHCPLGGTRIDSGLDKNKDNSLTTNEITSTQYVCNGATGTPAIASLIDTAEEPAGNHCIDGGLRIVTGQDTNKNSILDTSEIVQTQYLCETRCTVLERKISAPAIDYVCLDYPDTVLVNDNVLRVESTSESDVVSWIGFDLTNVPNNSVILGATLHVRHDSVIDLSNADNPSLQVLLGTANHFDATTVSTTNLPKGSAVSATVTNFALDGWNEIVLSLPTEALTTDLADDYLTLGLDEVTTNNGNHFIAFYGSADAATRPYVELTVVSCETSP
jgi:hypothetical protein